MEKIGRVAVSYRLLPENYRWLKLAAAQQDRSVNWLVDRLVSQAREADQAKENAPEVAAPDALVQ